MKLSITGVARLVEKRSDARDNVNLSNSVRTLVNNEGLYFRQLTTTDATPTEIWRDTVNADSLINLEIVVVSYGAFFSSQGRRQVAYRVGTGVVTLDGAWEAMYPDHSTGPIASIAVSGGDVVLSVTGVAATKIDWNARIRALWTPFE